METKAECKIGITGHRFLAELDKLRQGLDTALEQIAAAYPGAILIILSALAEGADRLAAESVLGRSGGRLEAVLPMPQADYEDDFVTLESKDTFRALLGKAMAVTIMDPVESRNDAYAAAGLYILTQCDVLMAVWDEQVAQGTGGTGEIVTAARAQGKPVVIVRAGNRRPGTQEPTSLGELQGTVVTERLPSGK